MLARKFLRWHACSRSGWEKNMSPQAVYIWELFSMQNVQPNPILQGTLAGLSCLVCAFPPSSLATWPHLKPVKHARHPLKLRLATK